MMVIFKKISVFWGGNDIYLFIYIFYVWVFCMCVYLLITVMPWAQRSEESVIPQNWNERWSLPAIWMLEIGTWPLKRQLVLLAIDPLQNPLNLFFYVSYTWKIFLYLLYVYQNDISQYIEINVFMLCIFHILLFLPKYVDGHITTVIRKLQCQISCPCYQSLV